MFVSPNYLMNLIKLYCLLRILSTYCVFFSGKDDHVTKSNDEVLLKPATNCHDNDDITMTPSVVISRKRIRLSKDEDDIVATVTNKPAPPANKLVCNKC